MMYQVLGRCSRFESEEDFRNSRRLAKLLSRLCAFEETLPRSTRRSRPQLAQQTGFRLTLSAFALFGEGKGEPLVVERQRYLQDTYMSVWTSKPSAD